MAVKPGYKQTEVGVIPEEWNVLPLSIISNKITDGEHITPQRTISGYYLLSARNILDSRIDLSDVDFVGETEFRRIRKRCNPEAGDILISCSGTIGRVAILPQGIDCVMVRSAALVKPDSSKLNSVYAQFFLQSKVGQDQITTSVNQGAQPNLFLSQIQKINTVLPGIAEQEAIADALSDADALIEALEGLIAKKRLVKQGAMQELLTGHRRLPGFSGEWEERSLGEMGHCYRGVSYNPESDLSPFDGHTTIRLLRSNNIFDGVIVLQDLQFVDSKRVSDIQYLQVDDIVICMANGSRSLVGKAARFLAEDGFKYTFGAFMSCFRPDRRLIDPNFVFYLFHTEKYHQHIAILLAGSSINNLTPGNLESFSIKIPSSNEEQLAIAAILSDIDAEIAALEEKLSKARQVKQGMMQELLTGRTRLT